MFCKALGKGVFKGMGYTGRVFAIFYEGDRCYDFLFAFLKKFHMKVGLL